MGMSSPEVWKKSGTPGIAATPVGTGPFLFESQTPGDQLTIVKNPKYWNPADAAKADKIVFKALPDAATRVAALRAGEVHVIFAPPAQELASLKRGGFHHHRAAEPASVVSAAQCQRALLEGSRGFGRRSSWRSTAAEWPSSC